MRRLKCISTKNLVLNKNITYGCKYREITTLETNSLIEDDRGDKCYYPTGNFIVLPDVIEQNKLSRATRKLNLLDSSLTKIVIQYLQGNPKSNVSSIVSYTGLQQSTISSRLSILKKKNLVRLEKVGKYVYCSVNEQEFSRIAGILRRFSKTN